ncbi:hypothetical protein WDV85_06655 [Pseudokineococcus sp. 5B2Z-1]|uniref:hypothetical protein n=1 Tax=Pseudokineococcus sp. 5B2Z-1 TaxID=3132744 RepID=UPI00309FE70D
MAVVENSEYARRNWLQFESQFPDLAPRIRRLLNLAIEGDSLQTLAPDGASIITMAQPGTNHDRKRGRGVYDNSWWLTLEVGRPLASQFGIDGLLPMIIATDDSANSAQLVQHFRRMARNVDTDNDIAILIADVGGLKAAIPQADRRIVHLTPDELAENSAPIRHHLAAAVKSADYFLRMKALESEDDFFGRREVLREIESTLLIDRQNVAIYGLRKAGKSSALNISRVALRGRGVATGSLDFSRRINDDLPALRLAVLRQLLQAMHATSRFSHNVVPAGLSDEIQNLKPPLTGTYFGDLLTRLVACSPERPVVLFVDETDLSLPPLSAVASPGSMDARRERLGLLYELRGLTQEEPTLSGQLLFGFAGINRALTESTNLWGEDNYLYSFARSIALRPLERHAVANLVRQLGKRSGLTFPDHRSVDLLHGMYGGHPFLIRHACSIAAARARTGSLGEAVPFPISHEAVRAAVELRGEKSTHKEVREILRSLYKYNPYRLLEVLDHIDSASTPLSAEALSFANRYALLDEEGGVTLRAMTTLTKEEIEGQVDV